MSETERSEAPEIVITSDGSHSLFVPGFKEQYHSRHGAIQESTHIFIDAGLAPLIEKSEVSIFEMGFGTGLNALLTSIYADEKSQRVRYTSLEAFPIDVEMAEKLNYPQVLGHLELRSRFLKMHQQPTSEWVSYSDYFKLFKIIQKLEEVQLLMEFDLIYFDAFSPEVQPGLWTPEVFKKMYDSLKPAGRLITYCSKGVVRRNMLEVGFMVAKLPGPPGKREILLAEK